VTSTIPSPLTTPSLKSSKNASFMCYALQSRYLRWPAQAGHTELCQFAV
jgi:hypothetical protein